MSKKSKGPHSWGWGWSHGWSAGGAAPFSPTDISSCVLWLDGDSITGLSDGDPVGTWSDGSGESNDATQSTTAKKPTYKTGIQNSKPVVRFDGTDDYLTSAGLTLDPSTTNFTIAIVFDDAGDSKETLIQQLDGDGDGKPFLGHEYDVADRLESYLGNEYSTSTTDYTDNTFVVYAVTWDGTDINFFKNGTADGSNSVTAASADGGWRIGADKAGKANFWDGDVCELIIYNSELSAGDRADVETYLNSGWAIY